MAIETLRAANADQLKYTYLGGRAIGLQGGRELRMAIDGAKQSDQQGEERKRQKEERNEEKREGKKDGVPN